MEKPSIKIVTKTKTRAGRISEEDWKKHDPQIRQLYKKRTLDQVMECMRQEHGFAPSKRQYVYRLGKPNGVRKYNAAGDRGPASSERDDEESYGEHDADSRPPSANQRLLHDHQSMSFDHPWSSAYPTPPPPPQSQPPGSTDIKEVPPIPWDRDQLRRKQAADFLFALSDDNAAFQIYADLHEALANQNVLRLGAAQPHSLWAHLSVVACARAAEQEEDRNRARELLNRHCESEIPREPEELFVFRMLGAFTSDRDQNDQDLKAEVVRKLHGTLSSVVKKGPSGKKSLVELHKYHTALDMITLQLLTYGVETIFAATANAAGAGSGNSRTVESFKQVVDQFINQQPVFDALGRVPTDGPLKDCVRWCERQLAAGPALHVPEIMESIWAEPVNITWKENILLFSALWDRWQETAPYEEQMLLQGGGRGAPSTPSPSPSPPSSSLSLPLPGQATLPWAARSELELGLSPTELLVVVSWMIMKCAEDGEDGDGADTGRKAKKRKTKGKEKGRATTDGGDGHASGPAPGLYPGGSTPPPSPQPDFLQRAAKGAGRLDRYDIESLWDAFISMFLWMNALVEKPKEDRRFEARAIRKAREYVCGRLGVALPDCVPAVKDEDDDEDVDSYLAAEPAAAATSNSGGVNDMLAASMGDVDGYCGPYDDGEEAMMRSMRNLNDHIRSLREYNDSSVAISS